MNPEKSPPPGADEEVSALIATLHQTGQRLEELTGGEVDTVTDRDGQTFLLQHAQDRLRHSEAAKQAAILNALPAHIALLDAQGLIISVNDGWRQFSGADAIQRPGYEIGLNYLDICDSARGDDSSEAHQVAEGIRSVLAGGEKNFSIEYPCDSPAEKRWFLLTVTPLANGHPNGAVVMHLDITERRRTQAALAQSEDGLHRAEVMAKLAHVITGPDGSFETWSETLPRLVGVEPADVPRTTRAWLNILHPDDRSIFRDKAIEAGVKKLRVEIEYRLQRADGEWINVRQTMEPLKTVATSGLRWFNTLQDVTVERRGGEALRRFSLAMDATADAIYLVDRSSMRFIHVNAAACRMNSQTREELLALGPAEVLSTSREELERTYDAIIAGGEDAEPLEMLRSRKDGSQVWVELRRHAQLAGDRWTIVTLVRDITERKRVALELRESERRLSSMLGNVQLISVMLDREARITYCNEYLLRLTGWRHEEVIGRSWVELFIPPEIVDLKNRLAVLLSDLPDGRHGENKILTRSGERRLIRWNNSVLRSAEGDVIGTASIGEDITEQKQAEVRIKRLNRVYAVLSQINALIVRVQDREELFREVCRIAVSEGGFILARVLELDSNASARIAATSESDARLYQRIVDEYNGNPEHSQSLVALALRSGKPLISNDVAGDPRIPDRAALTKDGNYALALLPIFVEKRVAGAIVLRAREAGMFNEDELRLLLELSGNISFALDHIEKEQKLKSSESLKGAILESSLDCIITIDHEGKVVEFNPAAQATFGLTREQALGKDMVQLIVPPRLRDAHRRGFAHYLATGKGPILGKRLELEAVRADGTEFPVELAITAIGAASTPMFTAFIRDITARKEAEEKIKRLNRVYAVLSGINTLIVRVRDRDELFREASRIAVEQGKFRMAWIGVVDGEAGMIKPVASAGDVRDFFDTAPLAITEAKPGSHGLAGRAVRDMKPVISNDVHSDPQRLMRPQLLERGINSLAVIPLIVGGEPIGVLALYSTDVGFFDEEEMRLLQELAGDISFAIEHIEKAEKLDHITRVNAILSGINGAIVRIRDRQELFEEACRIAVETGGLAFAWLCVVDEAEERLRPVASAGPDDGFLEMIGGRFSLRDDAPEGHGLGARAVRDGRALVVNDIQAADLKYKKAHADRGIKSAAALPLFIAGRIVGAFGLHASEVGFFDADEMKLLKEVAGNIAFALEHIEKEEKVRRLTRVYAVLSGINTLIVRVGDRDELFKEACRIAVEHGKFKMAWIGVVDRSAMKIVPIASAGAEPEFLALVKDRFSLREDAPMGNTLTARAVREKKAIVSNEIRGDARILFAKDRTERGIHSMAILPLLVADDAVGVLALYAGETGFFDEQEMELLTELAGDIAFAIDHIEKADKLDYLAYYDELTGLANRRLFLERVAQYMRSAAGGGHKLALFLVDLERFKSINDTLGRPAGDALLRQVAEWMTSKVGDASLLARVGTDHFAVVLPEIKQEGNVAGLLEKAMEAFLEHPFRLNDSVFRIAIKVGVALFPDDGANADTLFKNAEAALKKTKARGDRYLFYKQKMTDTVAGKLTLENQLRQALDKEEFVLHYQPKVNLVSGKLTSAEALIRWNDPLTGLVPPGRFIPILEETGLIHEVGRWALRQALSDYLRWRTAGLPAVRISVNVSALQLRHRGFIEEIKQAIGIDAHAAAGLELELTESMIMEDVKHNIASLQAIRAMGVTMAIDDFGTGFSSLAYLSKLPVDTLKIDRSFVIDMTAGPQGLALVSTIINLAHSLKLTVVAEGVETEEQSRLLRLLNCDEMQGFLFGKPVPVEIFETKFLATPSAG